VRFSERTVLVTGAGRGIGRSIALRFAEEGARVALVARTVADLEETARQVAAAGGRSAVLAADITSPGAPEDTVARTEKSLGHIAEGLATTERCIKRSHLATTRARFSAGCRAMRTKRNPSVSEPLVAEPY